MKLKHAGLLPLPRIRRISNTDTRRERGRHGESVDDTVSDITC